MKNKRCESVVHLNVAITEPANIMIEFDYARVSDRVELNQEVLRFVDKNDAYLAGGALRGIFGKDEIIADYDIFFSDDLSAAATRLDLEEGGWQVVFTCPLGHLTTHKKDGIKVQCISENYYYNADHLINTFDINACRIALWKNKIYTDRVAIRDMRRKRVTLHNVDFPAATFKRIIKYSHKGYNVDNAAITFYIEDIATKVVNGGRIAIDGRFYID